MNNPTKYYGVDVSKSYLDVDGLDKPCRFPNTPEGCAQLFALLPVHAHLVCEASGGYERVLCAAAWSAGRPISLVGADRVRAFARSLGQYAKTDRLDAALLTRFATERKPAPVGPPDEVIAQLRAHLRSREYVLELQRAEANHREHLVQLPALLEQSQARRKLLDAQISELEKAIVAIVASKPALAQRAERLQQVKGVGKITAWTICADLPELGTLQSGQAAALCGLVPYARDSADTKGHRFIALGRSTLRRVLHMAAVTASIHNAKLREVYTRLKKRGKPTKVAFVAIARRLIEFLNHIVKNPDYGVAS